MSKSTKIKLSKKEILIFSLFLAFLLPLFVLIFSKESEEIENRIKSHPELTLGDRFSSKVRKISMERGIKNKGAIYVALSDGGMFTLPSNSRNLNYSPNNIYEFAQEGDSIWKRTNRDTIYIGRNNKIYFFLFRKTVEKPIR